MTDKKKRIEKKQNIGFETVFASVLAKFDAGDKKEVATELIDALNLERHGPSYKSQVEKILERELTQDEEFKLWVLNTTTNYSGGGNDDDDNYEEEE